MTESVTVYVSSDEIAGALPPVVVTLDSDAEILAAAQPAVHVEVGGLVGPRGPAGTAGGSVQTYMLAAVSSYDAAHPFSTPPDVVLVNASGDLVETDVSYAAGHVYLSFPSPFTGTLYLS